MVRSSSSPRLGPPPNDLVVLMTAYKNAKTKTLKRQILSLYTYRYPMSMVPKIHQPYGKLSTWGIKQAHSHAYLSGPGTTPEVTWGIAKNNVMNH